MEHFWRVYTWDGRTLSCPFDKLRRFIDGVHMWDGMNEVVVPWGNVRQLEVASGARQNA